MERLQRSALNLSTPRIRLNEASCRSIKRGLLTTATIDTIDMRFHSTNLRLLELASA